MLVGGNSIVTAQSDSIAKPDNQFCLDCHSDETLSAESGKSVFVNSDTLHSSVHKTMACVDCHNQPGANFEDVPHFSEYKPVNCELCHKVVSAT